MYEDKTLVCKECGNEFVFTAGAHVLSRTPAPDVRMQGQTQEQETIQANAHPIETWCGTKAGPLTSGKEPPQTARTPDPGKENP